MIRVIMVYANQN